MSGCLLGHCILPHCTPESLGDRTSALMTQKNLYFPCLQNRDQRNPQTFKGVRRKGHNSCGRARSPTPTLGPWSLHLPPGSDQGLCPRHLHKKVGVARKERSSGGNRETGHGPGWTGGSSECGSPGNQFPPGSASIVETKSLTSWSYSDRELPGPPLNCLGDAPPKEKMGWGLEQ